MRRLFISLVASLSFLGNALAQQLPQAVKVTGGYQSLGYCQLSSLSSATSLTASTCAAASFTGTGAGQLLTVSGVTGTILPPQQLSGTGVPAQTVIESQVSGAVGGAGVYNTNNPTTSNGASLSSGGVPSCGVGVTPCSILAEFCAESVALRYRDDGIAPTSSIGMPIIANECFQYAGPLAALQFIQQASNGVLDVTFYK